MRLGVDAPEPGLLPLREFDAEEAEEVDLFRRARDTRVPRPVIPYGLGDGVVEFGLWASD